MASFIYHHIRDGRCNGLIVGFHIENPAQSLEYGGIITIRQCLDGCQFTSHASGTQPPCQQPGTEVPDDLSSEVILEIIKGSDLQSVDQ